MLTQFKHKLRMESTICTIFLALLAGAIMRVEAADWNYDDKGPSTWATLFPDFCAGKAQSPIDLNSKIAVAPSQDPGPIQFHHYHHQEEGVLTNNGHSVVFHFKNKTVNPTISGGRLPKGSIFEFLSLHWHWGSMSTRGSEHTMDGKEFPLELHIIHWNRKYGSFAESIKHQDGLAVLGFFYEVSEEDNENLEPIMEKLKDIKTTKKAHKQDRQKRDNGKITKNMTGFCGEFVVPSMPIYKILCDSVALDDNNDRVVVEANRTIHLDENMSLSQFLPTDEDGEKYFYYQGGLTTPACNEIVLWTNFLGRNKISESQLEAFRSLYDGLGDGTAIEDNFRPPQPLNGRTLNIRKPAGYGGKVNCGCHWAGSCKQCGMHEYMCNGDCSWQCKEGKLQNGMEDGCMCAPNQHK